MTPDLVFMYLFTRASVFPYFILFLISLFLKLLIVLIFRKT